MRRNFPRSLILVLVAGIGAYLIAVLGVKLLNEWSTTSLLKAAGVKPSPHRAPPPIGRSLAHQLEVLVGAVATLGVATEEWGRRAATEAWRKGAEGEETMQRRLGKLERHGFQILHDRLVPGSTANIDHLVIGPTGVFLVDTKNYTGRLTWSKGTLWHGRVPMTKTVATTQWEAERATEALSSVLGPLGLTVTPIMCVLGAEIPNGRLRVDDVRIISGGRALNRLVRSGRTMLTVETIERVADLTNATLIPALG